ncbi:response regulator [Candidatus Woesearchaeota archaeon]|nr:response regulator [Candidatus Woesearchaeota archaeon]
MSEDECYADFPASAEQARHRVLVVDDEHLIRKMYVQILRRGCFEVLPARDGLEALDIIRQAGEIALVLTDNQMPRMNGIELLDVIRAEYPRTTRILATSTERPANGLAHYYLQKPFGLVELNSTIQSGLADYIRRCEESGGQDDTHGKN